MIWKKLGTYEISNTGKMRNKHGRFLKPITKHNTEYFNLPNKNGKFTNKSLRVLLKENFNKNDISYDIGIPPRKALINRIKSGKIGVYKVPKGLKGKNKWRYLIQFNGKHHVGYYTTKLQARINWIMKYSELYDLRLTTDDILGLI